MKCNAAVSKLWVNDKYKKDEYSYTDKYEMEKIIIEFQYIKNELAELIKEYIYVEKNLTGLKYQQKSFCLMGQISILASLISITWERKKSSDSYYEYINKIIEKLGIIIEEKLPQPKEIKNLRNEVHLKQIRENLNLNDIEKQLNFEKGDIENFIHSKYAKVSEKFSPFNLCKYLNIAIETIPACYFSEFKELEKYKEYIKNIPM